MDLNVNCGSTTLRRYVTSMPCWVQSMIEVEEDVLVSSEIFRVQSFARKETIFEKSWPSPYMIAF